MTKQMGEQLLQSENLCVVYKGSSKGLSESRN